MLLEVGRERGITTKNDSIVTGTFLAHSVGGHTHDRDRYAFMAASDDRHPVIIVQRTCGADVAPVPVVVVAIFRRAAQLALGHAGAIAAEPGVILQRLPGQRIMIVAETE